MIRFVLLLLLANIAAALSTTITPDKPFNGGVAVMTVTEFAPNVTLTQEDKPIPLFECGKKKKKLCAIIGFPIEEEMKRSKLELKWKEGDSAQSRKIEIPLTAKPFKEAILKVEPKKLHPTPEEEVRIAEEKKVIAEAYAQSSTVPLWSEKFRKPVSSGYTSPYGEKRMFNHEVQSQHYGVDIRAAEGSPVYTTAAGSVVLARELFYAGKMVILDHGVGVFSNYAHLSKIEVEVGQKVLARTRIGLSGSSGRSTGPHLHWGVRLSGLSVDPIEFLKISKQIWR